MENFVLFFNNYADIKDYRGRSLLSTAYKIWVVSQFLFCFYIILQFRLPFCITLGILIHFSEVFHHFCYFATFALCFANFFQFLLNFADFIPVLQYFEALFSPFTFFLIFIQLFFITYKYILEHIFSVTFLHCKKMNLAFYSF